MDRSLFQVPRMDCAADLEVSGLSGGQQAISEGRAVPASSGLICLLFRLTSSFRRLPGRKGDSRFGPLKGGSYEKFYHGNSLNLYAVYYPRCRFPIYEEMSSTMMKISANDGFEFLAGMVPLHRNTSNDARIALKRSERPEVQQLAQKIIEAREAEIAEMRGYREMWFSNIGAG